ncbi:MAG: lipopolysaccharide biosynthesis protein [Flavobacteriales bacterium]|nr:oligosaccharide flippase family protein [Crocinitomicaceae bacterium]MDB4323838.1 oligosaccharide flippase family protein [Crocinitomicaceae bacterium]|tara:strand:- start:6379 stop:7647 length:1269 start_codon:yes stop_codon:yes gene_type:complete
MFKKLNLNSEFIKHIAVLMSGTVMAQMLGYFFSPIVTRLYTPEEAGELGLFIRIVAIIGAFATLRYELALPIAKNDSHSFRLYRIALKSAIIVSLISLVILFIPIGFSLEIDNSIFYLLMPIAILFVAINNIGTNWAIRHKFFKSISYARISNSLGSNITKVGLGWLNFGSIGLIIGMVVGAVIATFWFLYDFFTAKKKYQISSNSPRNYLLAKEYKEFPKISLPHVLMDLGRDLLIAVLLLKLFSKEDFGLYDLSFRMLRMPLIFIGVALGQVFFQRCAEKVNSDEDIVPLITKAIKTLALLSIVPFSIIFFFGEEIFAFVFGEEWRESGRFSEILVPWFMMNFIASPISAIPVILRKQREFFRLAILGTTIMISAIVIPAFLFNFDIISTFYVLSIAQTFYLIFVIFRIFQYAKKVNYDR